MFVIVNNGSNSDTCILPTTWSVTLIFDIYTELGSFETCSRETRSSTACIFEVMVAVLWSESRCARILNPS